MSDNFYNPAFFEYYEASHRLLADNKGEPLTVYHATEQRFETFFPLSHFGSITAAQTRIKKFSHTKHVACSFVESAGDCFKNINLMLKTILNSIQSPKKEKRYVNEPIYIPVHLALRHPKRMIEMGFYRSGYKDDLLYRMIKDQLTFGFRFYRHLTSVHKKNMALYQVVASLKVPPMYDFIFVNPFKITDEAVNYELGLEHLYPILGKLNKNPNKDDLLHFNIEQQLSNNSYVNRMNLSMQRMIRYWEALGYDGFIYENTVDDNGAFSYVIFRPEQAIRLDREGQYQTFPVYINPKNQQKLDEIRDRTLSQMAARPITKAEISRMTAWYLESNRFYEKY